MLLNFSDIRYALHAMLRHKKQKGSVLEYTKNYSPPKSGRTEVKMDKTQTDRAISSLTPTAQTACRLFLKKCGEAGLKVLITETYRSQERQDYLYEQGRTRPGNIVTWTKSSRHTGRRAWDIAQNIKGEEYSDSGFFKACGKIAEKLDIIWGGTWKQADTPHFEIKKDWKPPIEEEEIDVEELKKIREELEFIKKSLDTLGDRITRLENPVIYNYVDSNMPEWARETIKKLSKRGIIFGNADGELGLELEALRLLVILDRAGVFDK